MWIGSITESAAGADPWRPDCRLEPKFSYGRMKIPWNSSLFLDTIIRLHLYSPMSFSSPFLQKWRRPVRHGWLLVLFNAKSPFAWCPNCAAFHNWREMLSIGFLQGTLLLVSGYSPISCDKLLCRQACVVDPSSHQNRGKLFVSTIRSDSWEDDVWSETYCWWCFGKIFHGFWLS